MYIQFWNTQGQYLKETPDQIWLKMQQAFVKNKLFLKDKNL